MPSLADLTTLGEHALLLSLVVSLPAVGIAALVGVIVAAVQAVTQLQDPTIAHLPRLFAVALLLVVVAPWMGAEIAGFAREALTAR